MCSFVAVVPRGTSENNCRCLFGRDGVRGVAVDDGRPKHECPRAPLVNLLDL